MTTIEQIEKDLEVTKYMEQAKYSDGVADALSRVLAMFDNELKDHTRQWIITERNMYREQVTEYYQKAMDVRVGTKK